MICRPVSCLENRMCQSIGTKLLPAARASHWGFVKLKTSSAWVFVNSFSWDPLFIPLLRRSSLLFQLLHLLRLAAQSVNLFSDFRVVSLDILPGWFIHPFFFLF